jgi:2-dehydro-3-deoxyphosphogluconate aldolase/(4S)-4-hydroxy-2-oxoglutarate aldolase
MKNLEAFWPQRIIPIVVLRDSAKAAPVMEALIAAGLDMIDVALRTDASMESIRIIRKEFPDIIVGAGTVFTRRQVHELQELDVSFIVTPGLNEDVVGAARERDLPIIPGVMTPTEVDRARALGLKHLQFFPAEAAGGARMLRASPRPTYRRGCALSRPATLLSKACQPTSSWTAFPPSEGRGLWRIR